MNFQDLDRATELEQEFMLPNLSQIDQDEFKHMTIGETLDYYVPDYE